MESPPCPDCHHGSVAPCLHGAFQGALGWVGGSGSRNCSLDRQPAFTACCRTARGPSVPPPGEKGPPPIPARLMMPHFPTPAYRRLGRAAAGRLPWSGQGQPCALAQSRRDSWPASQPPELLSGFSGPGRSHGGPGAQKEGHRPCQHSRGPGDSSLSGGSLMSKGSAQRSEDRTEPPSTKDRGLAGYTDLSCPPPEGMGTTKTSLRSHNSLRSRYS